MIVKLIERQQTHDKFDISVLWRLTSWVTSFGSSRNLESKEKLLSGQSQLQCLFLLFYRKIHDMFLPSFCKCNLRILKLCHVLLLLLLLYIQIISFVIFISCLKSYKIFILVLLCLFIFIEDINCRMFWVFSSYILANCFVCIFL